MAALRLPRLKIQAGYRELWLKIAAIESQSRICTQHPGGIREFQFRE
jgi:hypothetical protein